MDMQRHLGNILIRLWSASGKVAVRNLFFYRPLALVIFR